MTTTDVIITITERGVAAQIIDRDTDQVVFEANDLDGFDEAVTVARRALSSSTAIGQE